MYSLSFCIVLNADLYAVNYSNDEDEGSKALDERFITLTAQLTHHKRSFKYSHAQISSTICKTPRHQYCWSSPRRSQCTAKAGNHCFRKRYFFQSMESEELSATLPWMEVGRLKRKLGSRSVRLIHSHSQKNTNSLSKYIPFHGGGKHTKDPSLVTIFCWINLPC